MTKDLMRWHDTSCKSLFEGHAQFLSNRVPIIPSLPAHLNPDIWATVGPAKGTAPPTGSSPLLAFLALFHGGQPGGSRSVVAEGVDSPWMFQSDVGLLALLGIVPT